MTERDLVTRQKLLEAVARIASSYEVHGQNLLGLSGTNPLG